MATCDIYTDLQLYQYQHNALTYMLYYYDIVILVTMGTLPIIIYSILKFNRLLKDPQ